MLVDTGRAVTLLAGPPPVGSPRRRRPASTCSTRSRALADPPTAAGARHVPRRQRCCGCRSQPVGRRATAPCTPAASWAATSCAAIPSSIRFGATCARTTRRLLVDDVLDPPGRRTSASLRTRATRCIRFSLVRRRRDDRRRRSRLPRPARAAGACQPTRIVLRDAAPRRRTSRRRPTPHGDTCCKEHGRRARRRRGVDLALVLDTGVGPLVLSQSAWARVDGAARRQWRRRAAARGRGRPQLLDRDLADPDRRHLVDASRGSRSSTSRPAPPTIPAPASSWRRARRHRAGVVPDRAGRA